MYIRSNKKGFTLIEVMIVLSIIVIGAGIIGSCILTSIRLGDNGLIETEIVATCNEIDRFLEDGIEMSTAIYIGDEKHSDSDKWHSIWVEDGVLYLDGESIYDVNGSISVDFSLSEGIAKGRISIDAKGEGLDSHSVEYIVDCMNLDSGVPSIDKTVLSRSSRLWFMKEFSLVSTLPEENADGDGDALPEIPDNVEDDSTDYEILSGNSFGSTAEFFGNSRQNVQIFKGSLIYNEKDGYWYQAISTQWINANDFTENGTTRSDCLRKLDTVYDKADDMSNIYFKGDIIKVDLPNMKGIYKCIVDRVHWYGYPDQVSSNWEKMADGTTLKMVSIDNEIPMGSEGTVYASLEDDLKNPKYSFKGEYDVHKEYFIGDIIKVNQKAKEGADCVTYYRKVYEGDAKPGKSDNSNRLVWKVYTRKFLSLSAYEVGDVVWAYNSGTGYRFKFLKGYDSIISSDANTWLIYNSEESGWTEKININ